MDVLLAHDHARVVEGPAREVCADCAGPANQLGHELGDLDGNATRELVERGSEGETEAETANEYVTRGRDALERVLHERLLGAVNAARHQDLSGRAHDPLVPATREHELRSATGHRPIDRLPRLHAGATVAQAPRGVRAIPGKGEGTMSLTFYFAPRSTASITDLVIEELGIPCEKVTLDLKKGDAKTPAFVKINPNAKVPTIVHDGAVIWESAAITMYLGETFGVEKKLYPAHGPRRGEAMKWIVWTNVTLGDAIGRYARNTQSWVPAEQHNARAAEAAKDEVTTCLRVLDESLEGRSFLLGDYTLADTHLNSFTDWLRHMHIDFTPYARLNAWSARCSERPAYKKVMGAG